MTDHRPRRAEGDTEGDTEHLSPVQDPLEQMRSDIELDKLAAHLGVSAGDVSFLATSGHERIADLRRRYVDAAFARHEHRLRLLASLSRALPAVVTARIAEQALGPMLSARVAALLDPREAGVLAANLDPAFLARVASHADPGRIGSLIAGLPSALLIDVGHRLLAVDDCLTLGRLVAVVDQSDATQVARSATGAQLLRTATLADDQTCLERVLEHLADDRLDDVLAAVEATRSYDAAVWLLTSFSPATAARLVRRSGTVSAGARDDLIASIDRHGAWAQVLRACQALRPDDLRAVVNVPSTLDVALIDRIIGQAQAADLAPALVTLLLAMDEEHLDAVGRAGTLRDATIRAWLAATAGVAPRLVRAVLTELGMSTAARSAAY